MEWNGRWKPLQYSVKRAFSMISVSFSGAHNYDTTTLDTEVPLEVYVINDFSQTSFEVAITVSLVPWTVSDSVVGGDVWSEAIAVEPGSSFLAASFSVTKILRAGKGCTATLCFVKTSSKVISSRLPHIAIPESVHFLSPIKTAANIQQDVHFIISDVSIDPHNSKVMNFKLSANATSPFVFLELPNTVARTESLILDSITGWFSDNNFVAVADLQYALSYHFFDETAVYSPEQFAKLISVRSLQSVPLSC